MESVSGAGPFFHGSCVVDPSRILKIRKHRGPGKGTKVAGQCDQEAFRHGSKLGFGGTRYPYFWKHPYDSLIWSNFIIPHTSFGPSKGSVLEWKWDP